MTETHSPQTLGPAQRTGRLVRALAIGAVLIAAWVGLRSYAQLTGAERDVWWQGWLYAGSVLALGGGVALLGALAVLRGRGREAGWLLLLSGCAHTVTALVGIPQYVVLGPGFQDSWFFAMERTVFEVTSVLGATATALLPLWLPAGRTPLRNRQRVHTLLVAVLALAVGIQLTTSALYNLFPSSPSQTAASLPQLVLGWSQILLFSGLPLVVAVVALRRLRGTETGPLRLLLWCWLGMITLQVVWQQATAFVVTSSLGEALNSYSDVLTHLGNSIQLYLLVASGVYLLTAGSPRQLDIKGHRLVAGICAVWLATLVQAGTDLALTGFRPDENVRPITQVVALGAVGLVAVVPALLFWDRLLDRLLRGPAAQPYQVVSELAARLCDAPDPQRVPEEVCRTLVGGLRLAGAALDAQLPGGPVRLAEMTDGEPEDGGEVEEFELVHHAQTVGQLVVRLRPGWSLTDSDRAILYTLADQAAAAVAVLRLTEELRSSRERIVVGREEERRRIRRDLHDGLGPALAAIRLRLDTVRNRSAAGAREQLAQVSEQLGEVVDQTRRITDELRPPALDQLGLAEALAELVDRFAESDGPRIEADLPELGELPAAVEVAAYRIAAEALANAVRHSGASQITVRLTVAGGELLVSVADNGRGLPAVPRKSGIGLASMRERAQEIGGSLAVDSESGGTRVRAVLPLAGRT